MTNVHVCIIFRDDGETQISAHTSHRGAETNLIEYIRKEWDESIHGPIPPDDEIAEKFKELCEGSGTSFWILTQCELDQPLTRAWS
jgi:hypothetical protein